MLKRPFADNAISIRAILHVENLRTRESCIQALTKKRYREDPLDTLPHVRAAFRLGGGSFERIDDRVYRRGLRKGPAPP